MGAVCTVRQVRKLYALALGSCTEDNPDSLMHHDLMLPGHLMTMAFKERCQDLLSKFKQTVQVIDSPFLRHLPTGSRNKQWDLSGELSKEGNCGRRKHCG